MKSLSEIADLLQTGDEETRHDAVRALAGEGSGAQATDVMGMLLLGTQDESWRVRKTALDLLMEDFPPEQYIPSLIEQLYVEDKAGARNAAVEGLTRLGPRATDHLIDAFETPNADVRKFIIDILGEVSDRAATPLLIRAIGDEDENVKASAVEHLGTVKTPEVVDALIALLEQGDLWTAYPAAEALGKLGDARAVPALLDAMNEGTLREPALRAIGRLGDERVIGKVVPFIKDSSSAARHMAIFALEELYHRGISEDAITQGILSGLGEQAVPLLIEQAASVREEVKASSILLLGLLRDERALDPLLELAHEDEFASDIRRALVFIGKENPAALLHFANFDNTLMARFVVSVYAEVASMDYYGLLMEYLEDHDGHVRAMAARGLGRIGNLDAVERLMDHLDDEFEDVQEAVVSALTLLKDGLDISRLKEYMKSPNPSLRANSVLLSGELSSEAVIDSVLTALNDSAAEVRKAALGALLQHDPVRALPHIEDALTDEDPSLRMAAAHMLGDSGDERFLEPVVRLLADPDDTVRASAAKALGMMGTENAVGKLMETMHDKSGLVVTSAIEAIGKIGGEVSRRALIRALSHDEKEVQRTALDALSVYSDSEDIILPFLEDPDWATRTVAAQSLLRSKKDHVQKELKKALDKEEDSVVRKALMGAMGD